MPLQPSDVYGARLKVTLDRVKIEMSAVRGCLEGIMQARDETDALRHQLATLHELVNAQGDVLEKRVTGSVAAIVESQLVPLFEKLCASSYSLSASLKTAEANAIARARGQNARIEQVEISVQRKLEEFEAHVKLERSARTECRCGATLKSLEDRLKRGLREMDECKAQVAKLEQELRISKRHDLPFAPGAARSSTPGSPAGVQDSDQNVQQASIVTGRKEVSPGSPNTSALVPDNIAASPPSRRRSRLQTSEHTGHMAMSDEDLGTPARDYSATGKAIAAIARASSILAQYHTASSDSIMSTLTPLSSTATELGSSSHAVAAESVEHVPCTSTNYAGELTVQRRGVRKQSNHTAALFATHVREATLDQRKRLIEQDLSQGEKVGTGAHHTNEHQGAVVFFTDQDTEENEPDTEE
ncbi:uncharacterized protein JCM15063_001266 [Sporobolomyces koalae]|uniref:uncharacterized protein n=1 Tax=Sporobolomyces koalae TaxID=500713 RepID=UPI0031774367